MKLTDSLIVKLKEAENEEMAMKILKETKMNVEKAGIVLDDEDLEKVAGGKYNGISGSKLIFQ